MIYRNAGDIPDDRLTHVLEMFRIQDDLKLLADALESIDETERALPKVVAINRKLVYTLLTMIKNPVLLKELEYTELEVARLKRMEMEAQDMGFLTSEMRCKLRVYVSTYLRDNFGV